MNRMEALAQMGTEYQYQKLFKRLTSVEREILKLEVTLGDALPHLEFEYRANRIFLNVAPKPKNWAIILELMLAANTRAKGTKK